MVASDTGDIWQHSNDAVATPYRHGGTWHRHRTVPDSLGEWPRSAMIVRLRNVHSLWTKMWTERGRDRPHLLR
jgi:hypothetical protein